MATTVQNDRIILQKRRLPKAEASKIRKDQISNVLAQIRSLKQELLEIRSSPLLKTRDEWVTVKPGDPRYEKANYAIRNDDFVGRWSFRVGMKKP